jgi:Mg2+-importing ATPase
VRPRDPAAGARSGETLDELFARLTTSRSGLTSQAAQQRLRTFGPNESATVHLHSRVWRLLRGALSPLTLILLIASGASAALGETTNAAFIVSIVVLGAALDIFQTFRSEQAVAHLQRSIAPVASVLRDGVGREIPRREIVAGDIVQLCAGDLVPADVRLCEARDLHVQQAALTGESLPAEKLAGLGKLDSLGPDCPELLFLGTSIVSGTGSAVVFATGTDTAFGEIVTRLAARPEETEFERGMRHFGTLIVQTVLFLVLFIVVISVSLHRDPLQSVLFAVALAVGLTPEFLPMITTVTLAQGAVKMARAHVIVKHLSAIQNLGSIDVLCSDKTGTLTAGTMSLDRSLDPFGAAGDSALEFAALNSQFQTGIHSPLDAAVLAAHPNGGAGYSKIDELPFDFERRRLSVVVEHGAARTLITKGAPENVVPLCTHYERNAERYLLDGAARASLEATYRTLSEQGLRVLAVATRDVTGGYPAPTLPESDLVLLGFLTFADHLLDGVAESIAALRNDGVTIKILTGDNELVTREICRQAGLQVGQIVLGAELERMTEGALLHCVENTVVFARVSPAQKHRVLHALKSQGHVVGFMGDGINDAPSLHAADVGISVAGAADVAKEASDILLMERRLDVLHAGIVAGRAASANVMKYLLMGTSSNFGNMFSMAGAALFLPFLPMLPTQILLNSFLYDLAQVTIPSDNIDPLYIRRPQRWDVGLIRRFMWVIGPISSCYDFLTFYLLLSVFHFGQAAFHTGWFVESLATQTLVLFVIRTAGRPWKNRPSLALTTTTLLVAAGGVALPFTPLAATLGLVTLPASYYVFLLAVVASYLVLVELVKERVMRAWLKPAEA